MANRKIRGITVEIGGDFSKLGDALKDSEEQSKSLQSELKEVERALKFNPDNVELLAQKQEILTKQVSATEDALDKLKAAEKQVSAQFESGEIGEEQYRAFRREIVQTESKLKNYESKLDETETALKSLNSANGKAEKSTEELKKELKEAKDVLKQNAEAVKDLAGDLGKMGGAVVSGGVLAVTSANNVESALNSLQAQTGKSDAEMVEFKTSLENLYKGNYGESMDALATSMAKVAQFTGETDPKKIEDMTRNLITLEDTFEMDFNETLRGVNGLMKNMGLTSEEAFDYITKGAQNGLNKTDELGDNLAEYTQIWGQAGFNAEEMFSILDNGLKNGAYNLDKVNDFVKEFSISLSDGRIEENIDSFSGNTKKLFNEWKQGKATSADVFKSVIKDLKNTKNQQDALSIASNVWSALGEDNAMKIITSLGDVNDTFSDVAGTMEKVGEIKYDDLGNRLESLGRTVITDVVNPIGEDLIPIAEKFVEYVSENIDDIIPLVKTLGIAFATIFVVNKVAQFTNSIKSLKTTFTSLGATMSAHPLMLFATVLAGIGTALYAVQKETEKQIEKTWGLSEETKKLNEQIHEEANALKEATEARKEANSQIEAEMGHNQNLWKELQNIVSENGKIKKGYEDRAQVITGLLADSLGIEIQIVDGQIQKYGELKKSIEDVIATKKAEALLDVNKSAYNEALAKQDEAFAIYNQKISDFAESEQKLNDAQDKLDKAETKRDNASTAQGVNATKRQVALAKQAVEAATEAHNKNKKALDEANESYLQYCTTIENYEGLMEAVANGDAKALNVAMTNLSKNFKTAENSTKSMLETQLKDFKTQYANMKIAVEKGMPGVSQEQVDQMKDLVDRAEDELNKLQPKAEKSGKKSGENYAKGVKSQESNAKNSGKLLASNVDKSLTSPNTSTTGAKKGKEYASGVKGTGTTAKLAGKAIASLANSGLGSENTKKTGAKKGADFSSGVESKKGSAKTAGKKVAESGKSGLESVKATSSGEDFASGFGKGIKNKEGSIWSKAWDLGKSALSAIKKALKSNSPSKETELVGGDFDEGMAIGVKKNKDAVIKNADELAKDALKSLSQVNEVEFGGLNIGSNSTSKKLRNQVNSAEYNSTSTADNALGAKLDAIYDRLGRIKMVTHTGALVGEMLDDIDAGLAERQSLNSRGV